MKIRIIKNKVALQGSGNQAKYEAVPVFQTEIDGTKKEITDFLEDSDIELNYPQKKCNDYDASWVLVLIIFLLVIFKL